MTRLSAHCSQIPDQEMIATGRPSRLATTVGMQTLYAVFVHSRRSIHAHPFISRQSVVAERHVNSIVCLHAQTRTTTGCYHHRLKTAATTAALWQDEVATQQDIAPPLYFSNNRAVHTYGIVASSLLANGGPTSSEWRIKAKQWVRACCLPCISLCRSLISSHPHYFSLC